MSWMFEEPNPIGVNTAMAMCGLARPVFRLPYVPLSTQQREAGKKLMDPVLSHIAGADLSLSVPRRLVFSIQCIYVSLPMSLPIAESVHKWQ